MRMQGSCLSSRGIWRMALVMSDVISIFLTISNACAKTRHYCCNALTRDLPAERLQSESICNNGGQARHFRSDQLRQDQAEEDGDAGEESPAYKRNHRTGEGIGDIVKPLPPVMHCTPPLLLPHCLVFSHFF